MFNFMHCIAGGRLLAAIAALAITLGGIYAFRALPVDAFPDVTPSLVQVFTETEGLAPEEVERYVTYPIESAMAGLPNLKNMRSVSNFGLSVVNIYFEDGTDVYFARQVVGERLSEARGNIPDGFGDPKMGPISTGLGIILYFRLDDATGTRSLVDMREIQDWIIKYQLQTAYDLQIGDVISALERGNKTEGAQFLEIGAEQYTVRGVGLARSIEDLSEIVIKAEEGRPIRVGDLGEIIIGGGVRQGLATANGEGEVVAGLVLKLYGTNTSDGANLMSLGGVAIAIGIMVDGAIVITENVDRGLRETEAGQDTRTIVARSSTEVIAPLIAAVIVVIVVFLPSPKVKAEKPDLLAKYVSKASSLFVRRRFAAILLAGVLLLAGGLAGSRLGSEFTPALEEGDILLRITMAPSISLTEASATTTRIEKRLLGAFPEIKSIVTRIGRGEVGAHADPTNSAESFVELKPHIGQPIAMAVDELLTGTRAELAVKIFGPDSEVLLEQSKVLQSLLQQVDGAAEVQADQITGAPQLVVTVDRAALGRYGLERTEIRLTTSAGLF